MAGGSIVNSSILLTDPAWSILQYGDFDGDGRTDLLWRNSGTGHADMWLMNGVNFIGGGTLLIDQHWTPVHVGRFQRRWQKRCAVAKHCQRRGRDLAHERHDRNWHQHAASRPELDSDAHR